MWRWMARAFPWCARRVKAVPAKPMASQPTRARPSWAVMQSVLLRRAAQPNDHLSRFLSERPADFVDDTTPHNRDVLSPSLWGRHDVVGGLQEKEQPRR